MLYVILSKFLGIYNLIETVFVSLGMFFPFFVKRLFRYENDDQKIENKMVVFMKLVVSLMTDNDDPSLTIVHEERKLT